MSGTPAGTVVLLAAELRFRGDGSIVAPDCGLRSGELAVFCRPVVTAPAVVRRDGSVLAGGWLPDFARLGELERHLGDGVIETIVDATLEAGRLRKRTRRRIMSYPLVIRLMLAMSLMPDASYGEALARVAELLGQQARLRVGRPASGGRSAPARTVALAESCRPAVRASRPSLSGPVGGDSEVAREGLVAVLGEDQAGGQQNRLRVDVGRAQHVDRAVLPAVGHDQSLVVGQHDALVRGGRASGPATSGER